ncbi:MAG TPA: ATP-binding cassette domain-containing protein [Firmicutes bacterium]|nr:ATP-binding cassette domain-containing protein [Candidatus Fermentithermobacillaceae bacterium]
MRVGERPLLEVRELKKYFPIYGGIFRRVVGHVYAVDGVSFEVQKGETFGLVGESGCGKTTVGRTILRLLPATGGEVLFDGEDVLRAGPKDMQRLRRQMQIVFQDPFGSLNPRQTAGEIIGAPLRLHGVTRTKAETDEMVAELLATVKMHPSDAGRYPHEFSGGQRQRIGIARAIGLRPRLIICDEPVSALDVSIQSQVLRLFEELQEKLSLTYIFIAHGLHVVRHISDRVGVMYLGRIVEIGTSEALFKSPMHPYTRALISAIPVPDPDFRSQRIVLQGDVPSPARPPSGCAFHPRCPWADARCSAERPVLTQIDGRLVACHYATA